MEEFKARTIKKYGWKPDLPDHNDLKFRRPKGVSLNLPESADLRSGMPPVFDQGDLGSCTANSTAGQVWYMDKTKPFEPSRLFIYFNTRALEGTQHEDSGASIRDSIKSVVKWGFPPEADWPYDISKFAKAPPSKVYGLATKERVKTYERVNQDLITIKTALVVGFPVNFGFTVYESFESEIVARTGMVPMPKKTEAVLGGHAVLIVGYLNADEVFIVRNSWGSGWGDGGYFYMPFSYVLDHNLSDDLWIIKTLP